MTDCPTNSSIVTDTHLHISSLGPNVLCSQFTRTGRFAFIDTGFMKQTFSCRPDGLTENERDIACNADCSFCNGSASDNTKRRHVYTHEFGQGPVGAPSPCWVANVTTGTPTAFGSMRFVTAVTSYGSLAFVNDAFLPCEVPPLAQHDKLFSRVWLPLIVAAVWGLIFVMVARAYYHAHKRKRMSGVRMVADAQTNDQL